MRDTRHKQIAIALNKMLRSYVRYRLSENIRKRTIQAYWFVLKRHRFEPIMAAIEKAPELYPKSPPSAGELVVMARGDAVPQQREEDRAAILERERAEALAARDKLPRDPAGQSRYVESAPTEHERLARLWEIEDMLSGRDVMADTPPKIVKQRFAALDALMATIEAGARI